MARFSSRLEMAISAHGRLCLGIDPSESELEHWNLPDSAAGAREFALRLIEAAVGELGVIKPQVGFFERFGSAGFVALEECITAARDAGLLVIADAKRGDIGSTMLGYAQAWFGDDSPLRSDALTVSGYLGPDSLIQCLEYAKDVEGGLFLLAATSNSEAGLFQMAQTQGKTVALLAIESAQRLGDGDMGVVIGATQDLKEFGIQGIAAEDIGIPILSPGFGAQGAKLADLEKIFGASSHRVIASMSRELTKLGAKKLVESIKRAKEQL
jgi:orotidine-5'-phosphate decarboxylase